MTARPSDAQCDARVEAMSTEDVIALAAPRRDSESEPADSLLWYRAEAVRRRLAIEVLKLRARLDAALALTDTGTPEFRAAFPLYVYPMTDDGPRVPGQRVVEKIREVLLS